MIDADNSIVKWSLAVWVQLVAFALGMVAANYVGGRLAPVVFVIDIILLGSMILLRWRYRWKAVGTVCAIFILHIAVLLRPEDQPTMHLPLAILSSIVLLIALFAPMSRASSSSSPRT